jgi:UrcA family protein
MRYPAILAAAAMILGAATAFAAPATADTSATVAVEYSDLNLATKAGQARLERRIDDAARSVCGMDRISTGTRLPSTAGRQCYAETRARVHEQVAQAIARDGSRG